MVHNQHLHNQLIPREGDLQFGSSIGDYFDRTLASSGVSLPIIGIIVQIDYWISDSDSINSKSQIDSLLIQLENEPIYNCDPKLISLTDSFTYDKNGWGELKQKLLSKLPIGPGAIQTDLECEVAAIKSKNIPPLLKEQIRQIHRERMKSSEGRALGFSSHWGPENSVDFLEHDCSTTIVLIDTSTSIWTVQGYMIVLENPPSDCFSDKIWEALSSLDESLKVDFERQTNEAQSNEDFDSILSTGFLWMQAVAVSKNFSEKLFSRSGVGGYQRLISALNSHTAYLTKQNVLVGHCPVGINENTALKNHEQVGCIYDGTIVHQDPKLSVLDEFDPLNESGLALFWRIVGRK